MILMKSPYKMTNTELSLNLDINGVKFLPTIICQPITKIYLFFLDMTHTYMYDQFNC